MENIDERIQDVYFKIMGDPESSGENLIKGWSDKEKLPLSKRVNRIYLKQRDEKVAKLYYQVSYDEKETKKFFSKESELKREHFKNDIYYSINGEKYNLSNIEHIKKIPVNDKEKILDALERKYEYDKAGKDALSQAILKLKDNDIEVYKTEKIYYSFYGGIADSFGDDTSYSSHEAVCILYKDKFSDKYNVVAVSDGNDKRAFDDFYNAVINNRDDFRRETSTEAIEELKKERDNWAVKELIKVGSEDKIIDFYKEKNKTIELSYEEEEEYMNLRSILGIEKIIDICPQEFKPYVDEVMNLTEYDEAKNDTEKLKILSAIFTFPESTFNWRIETHADGEIDKIYDINKDKYIDGKAYEDFHEEIQQIRYDSEKGKMKVEEFEEIVSYQLQKEQSKTK